MEKPWSMDDGLALTWAMKDGQNLGIQGREKRQITYAENLLSARHWHMSPVHSTAFVREMTSLICL
jgi:hypothetical protein